VAFQGDAERIKLLESDLDAARASGGGAGSAAGSTQEKLLKEKSSALDSMRMENVALKLKVQTLKEKLANPSKSEETMKFLRQCYVKVKHCQDEKTAALKDYKESMDQLQAMFTKVISMNKQIADNTREQVQDITKRYRAEQMQRKLLYNQVQELRGNIRVFARVRADDRNPCMMKFPDETNVLVTSLDPKQQPINYEFEHVYSNKSTQEEVFKDTEALCMSCVDGYNVCIMAYGQTGSGKTWTMQGPPDNPGVNRRAIAKLIQHTDEREEVDYTLTVSVMEVRGTGDGYTDDGLPPLLPPALLLADDTVAATAPCLCPMMVLCQWCNPVTSPLHAPTCAQTITLTPAPAPVVD